MGSGRWLSEGWDWQAEAWLEDVEAEKGRLVGENTKLREEVASLAAQVEEANSQAQSAAGDGIGMVEEAKLQVHSCWETSSRRDMHLSFDLYLVFSTDLDFSFSIAGGVLAMYS